VVRRFLLYGYHEKNKSSLKYLLHGGLSIFFIIFGYCELFAIFITLHRKFNIISFKKMTQFNKVQRHYLYAIGMLLLLHTPIKAQDYQDNFDKYRIGGYGEIVANFKDYGINRFYGGSEGNSKTNHNEISIPRFVIAGDYKFNSKWVLGVEVEFEAGGTGIETELENTENGEYETELEKGGEVALEQFHLTRYITPEFNIRAGHIIVPVGLTNAHHEPINFFGTTRPEGETTIIPSTWHETGLEFFGRFGKGSYSFNYEAQIVTGLNANGFDRNAWVAGGKQGKFEVDNFTSPAYVARLNWTGVRGLRLGASFYWCANTGKNCDKLTTYGSIGKLPVTIFTIDGQYVNKYVTARANFMQGHLGNADKLGSRNGRLSNLSGYSRLTPIAKTALSYSGEVGVNLQSVVGNEKFPVIYPFVHYSYYNPQEKAAGTNVMDDRCQVSLWKAGLNWKALPNLVVKADYTTRQIGTHKIFGSGKYNSENEFAIGIAFVDWFFKK
jgi:hypothetical protein